MKPLLYISGPYSAETYQGRQQNILNAKRRYIETLKSGEWWAICPHTMTAEMEIHVPEMSHEEWIQVDITMLAQCDAIWADYPRNKGSAGTRLEVAWALLAGMPIHLGSRIDSAPNMLRNNRRKDLIDPVYKDLTAEIQKIFAMVADWNLPDPLHYKGSILLQEVKS